MPTATYLRPNNISRLHVSTVCMIKINYVNKNNKILETKFLVRSKKKSIYKIIALISIRFEPRQRNSCLKPPPPRRNPLKTRGRSIKEIILSREKAERWRRKVCSGSTSRTFEDRRRWTWWERKNKNKKRKTMRGRVIFRGPISRGEN